MGQLTCGIFLPQYYINCMTLNNFKYHIHSVLERQTE